MHDDIWNLSGNLESWRVDKQLDGDRRTHAQRVSLSDIPEIPGRSVNLSSKKAREQFYLENLHMKDTMKEFFIKLKQFLY